MPIKRKEEPRDFLSLSRRPLKHRVYKCEGCGTQIVLVTQHTNDCFPICLGTCRGRILGDPGEPDYHVYQTQTRHEYVRDYVGPLKQRDIVVD